MGYPDLAIANIVLSQEGTQTLQKSYKPLNIIANIVLSHGCDPDLAKMF